MVNNTELQHQNRIWLPGYAPVSYDDAYELIQRSQKADNPSSEGELHFRKSPFSGDSGVIDIGNISVQATLQTMLNGYGLKNRPISIFNFLNPPEIGLDSTPYPQRLAIVNKIFQEFDQVHSGASYVNVWDQGWIHDPTTSLIKSFESSPHYWMQNKQDMNPRFEILYDTHEPKTKFLIGDYISNNGFSEMKRKHLENNLFIDGPLEFICGLGYGYYVPVLGVSELCGIEEQGEFMSGDHVLTTLSKSGIDIKEVGRRDSYLQEEGSYS